MQEQKAGKEKQVQHQRVAAQVEEVLSVCPGPMVLFSHPLSFLKILRHAGSAGRQLPAAGAGSGRQGSGITKIVMSVLHYIYMIYYVEMIVSMRAVGVPRQLCVRKCVCEVGR